MPCLSPSVSSQHHWLLDRFACPYVNVMTITTLTTRISQLCRSHLLGWRRRGPRQPGVTVTRSPVFTTRHRDTGLTCAQPKPRGAADCDGRWPYGGAKWFIHVRQCVAFSIADVFHAGEPWQLQVRICWFYPFLLKCNFTLEKLWILY